MTGINEVSGIISSRMGDVISVYGVSAPIAAGNGVSSAAAAYTAGAEYNYAHTISRPRCRTAYSGC